MNRPRASERQVAAKGHRKLYTDWYGGEPMLNREAIEYFTPRALERRSAYWENNLDDLIRTYAESATARA